MPMIEDRLQQVVDQFSGTVGYYAKNLKTGEELERNANELFETASSIKVLLMVELFRKKYEEGLFEWEDPLTLTEENQVAGSGVMKTLKPGASFTVWDTCALMMAVSDNSATNMLIDFVGGVEPVNATARALGLPHSELHRKISFSAGSLKLGTSAPRDYGRLLELLYRGEVISEQASSEMIGLMKNEQLNLLLTRYLPYELLVPQEGEDKPRVQVAAKYGWLRGSRNDPGIIFTPAGDYIISLWTRDSTDERYTVDQEAMVLIPHVSRAIFDHFVGKELLG